MLAFGLTEREWRAWSVAWHRVSDGATQREASATLLLGSTALRVPTDAAWWQSIRVEPASEQKLEEARAERPAWEAYLAPELAA